ncbi:putative D-tyrosyl-tRNA(Tyr) deacylase 2 [Portunus trituberculatus]|uniref:D-aminoacyl-tRNA deacylase n=1 Tax=Portunus trituberculatus TaxID=210409 RepID=A0A5B7CD77_PORTR|nr:putative D-tyrosyl-tRNA(Tyr) deacylase 2 [Portunus trituberculatus]
MNTPSAQEPAWCRCAAFVSSRHMEIMVLELPEVDVTSCQNTNQCRNRCVNEINTMTNEMDLWSTVDGDTVGQYFCHELFTHGLFWIHNSYIGRGMVVFVCFLEKATEETVDKLSKHITNVRLCENDNGRRVSVCDVQGDVLIVPQATLGGKLKGKAMQYHMNIDKVFGEALYRKFCHQVRSSSEKVSSGNVKCGVYGTRQVLSMDTNGPYTHIIEV